MPGPSRRGTLLAVPDLPEQTIDRRVPVDSEDAEHWLVRYTFHLTLAGIFATGLVAILGLPGPVDGLVLNYGARVEDPDSTLKVAAGLAAAFLAVAALGRYELSRMSHTLAKRAQESNHDLAVSGQITERFTQAAQLLGGGLDVRLGGIYALERIAKDSTSDAQTVIDVLSAFVREHTSERRRDESPPLRESASALSARVE